MKKLLAITTAAAICAASSAQAKMAVTEYSQEAAILENSRLVTQAISACNRIDGFDHGKIEQPEDGQIVQIHYQKLGLNVLLNCIRTAVDRLDDQKR